KKLEEKRIEEEQAAQAQNSKILFCYDDDDDYSAVTPSEPIDSLSMGDEHLDTIPATKSEEFIKLCVENLVPIPNNPMPPSIDDDEDSERDILFLERLLHDDPIPLPDTL
nr:hypothetical protein [Tanacetum cinerariifolium]